ncbi:MAG: TIR domain-containing protein [Gemmatimonadales bacterium]|jgi:hypothetical protein
MGRSVKFDVSVGDVTSFEADVVAVKYAEGLFGAAETLAAALGKTEEDLEGSLASVGSRLILPAAGKIRAGRALFLSVVSLARFDLMDVQRFAFDVLHALSSLDPEVRHLVLTLHGTGLGLNPMKVLRSEIEGCSEAIRAGACPPLLERISIIDRDEEMVGKLKHTLSSLLPGGEIDLASAEASSTPMHANETDGPLPSIAEYDVFVSYKSADMEHASKVYELLEANGLRVFFSKESLPRLGSDEYHEQIDRAIEKARHMVVVTSSRANVEAKWVQYEWRLFLGEKLAGRKHGNLITVTAGGLDIGALPLPLRHREVVRLVPGELDRLVDYLRRDAVVGDREEFVTSGSTPAKAEDSGRDSAVSFADTSRIVRIADFFVSKTEVLEDVSWVQAQKHAGSLSIDGTRGWRLPTIEQLREIRAASLFSDEHCYWSRNEAEHDEAYYVHYDDGHVGRGPKTYGKGLRAIFVYEE